MKKKLIVVLPFLLLLFACTSELNEIDESLEVETKSSSDLTKVKISISGSPDFLLLGQKVVVELFSDNGYVPTDYEIEYSCIEITVPGGEFGSSSWILQNVRGNNNNIDYEFYATKAGLWDIAVYFRTESDYYYSERFSIDVRYPHINDIIEDKQIRREMQEAWRLTLQSEKDKQRNEYGFVVYMNTYTEKEGEYYIPEIRPGQVNNSCADASRNEISLTFDEYPGTPNGEGRYYVTFFHTHPPRTNCSSGSREVGPSDDKDISLANTLMIPGILYDYSSKIYGGHNLNDSYELYIYGNYDRRQVSNNTRSNLNWILKKKGDRWSRSTTVRLNNPAPNTFLSPSGIDLY